MPPPLLFRFPIRPHPKSGLPFSRQILFAAFCVTLLIQVSLVFLVLSLFSLAHELEQQNKGLRTEEKN